MTNITYVAKFTCQVCEKALLQSIEGFESLSRITSDCRQFPAGGHLTVCMGCGAVQKIADEKWLQEINQIYFDYQTYRIANGEEQMVLDPLTGKLKKRSTVILQALQKKYEFPIYASVNDIGCGDGVTLKAISKLFPQWELYGHELNSKKREVLAKIPQFKQLFTGDLTEIEQNFDLITMIHSLEHFPQPLKILKQLRHQVKDKGNIFIQVCNVEENPFDLLIADHLMHFSPSSLANIAGQANFQCMMVETNWIKKEISFFGSAKKQCILQSEVDVANVYAMIKRNVTWLSSVINDAKFAARSSSSFGIFGTSIAASWLAVELADQIRFFVDEDPHRVGQQYMNKPVISPENVPAGSAVYLALAPAISARIAQRFQKCSWSMVKTPFLG